MLVNKHPTNASPEKELDATRPIRVNRDGLARRHGPRVAVASLRFNPGTLQLPLPMCSACLDIDCGPDSTCKRG